MRDRRLRGGTLQKAPNTWEVRDSWDSKGGTLDEMSYSRERKLKEPTSSRKTGYQMREEGHPIVTTLMYNCSCLKELQGWKWRGKKVPGTGPKCDSVQGRPQGLTLLLVYGALTKRDLS